MATNYNTIAQPNWNSWAMPDYLRELNQSLPQVEDTRTPEECTPWNRCRLCLNPEPIVAPEPEPEPEPETEKELFPYGMPTTPEPEPEQMLLPPLPPLPEVPKLNTSPKPEPEQMLLPPLPLLPLLPELEPDYTTRLLDLVMNVLDENKKLKSKNKKLKSKNKKLKSKNKKLKKELKRACKQESRDMDEIDHLKKQVEENQRTYIDSPAPEEFYSSDPDYEIVTEPEEEESVSEEEEEIETDAETEPEEDVPEKLSTEELENLVKSIIDLESIISGDDGSSFRSEHRLRAQEDLENEMDKLRLADPALADRVAKAISEDLWATSSESEIVKHLMAPL